MRSAPVLLVGLAVSAPACWAAEPKILLSAGEEPDTKAWTQPASISFSSNADAADTWALDLAAKIEGQPVPMGSSTAFGRVVAQKNTQLKKEVETYSAEVGFKADFDTASGPDPDLDAWYLPTRFSLAWTDKTIFPDPKASCTVQPLPPDCVEQNETSVRASMAVQPFRSAWETTFAYKDATHSEIIGPAWTRAIVPVLAFFYDDIVDSKPNGAGIKPDGDVSGLKATVNLAVAPRWQDYRFVLSGGWQYVNALTRDSRREASFAGASSLVRVSLDYELGLRSFENERGWVPSIGVTYTNGDDPFTGKIDQDTLVLALKATFRAK